jgi:ABC-type transporter Mla subunit MlaD
MSARTHRSRGARHWLHRHQIALGVVLAAGLLALTIVAAESTNGIPFAPRYTLETTLPRDAAPIQSGAQVRVAGLVMGLVQDVTPTPRGQRVTFNVGGAGSPVGRDASVTVRLQSPAGQHYLAVDRGSYRRDPLPSGSVIPTAQTHRTDDLLDVIQGFDRTALANLAMSTQFIGDGFAGRGKPLNTSLSGLDLTTSRLTGILRATTPGDDVTGFLHGADLTARGFEGQQPSDPGRITTASALTFAAFAARSGSIASGLQQLRPTDDELLATLPAADATLSAANTLSRRFTPSVAALRQALPDLASLFATGPELRREAARLARAGVPPLSRLPAPLRAFAPSALMLGLAIEPLGPPLRYLALYGRELADGLATFYAANDYLSADGVAKNTQAAPAMFIFSCATGSDTNPRPGQLFTDRLSKPCT